MSSIIRGPTPGIGEKGRVFHGRIEGGAFHADGRPDWDTYAALTERLIDGGITVITPNGNTGEFYALTHAEAGRAANRSVRSLTNMEANPKIVFVGKPVDVAIDSGNAKNAR